MRHSSFRIDTARDLRKLPRTYRRRYWAWRRHGGHDIADSYTFAFLAWIGYSHGLDCSCRLENHDVRNIS